jgi:hypothetical protein
MLRKTRRRQGRCFANHTPGAGFESLWAFALLPINSPSVLENPVVGCLADLFHNREF